MGFWAGTGYHRLSAIFSALGPQLCTPRQVGDRDALRQARGRLRAPQRLEVRRALPGIPPHVPVRRPRAPLRGEPQLALYRAPDPHRDGPEPTHVQQPQSEERSRGARAHQPDARLDDLLQLGQVDRDAVRQTQHVEGGQDHSRGPGVV